MKDKLGNNSSSSNKNKNGAENTSQATADKDQSGVAVILFGKTPPPANTPLDMLYRGEGERLPTKIFQEGFIARGKDMDLLAHVNPVGEHSSATSGYISTTTSKDVALTFPKTITERRFLYEINPQRSAIDVNKELFPYVAKGKLDVEDYEYYKLEKEQAIPKQIRSSDIKGVWEVEMVAGKSPFSSSFTVKQDSFIPNPSYIPPVSTGQKLWFAGKMLGRTMTGVGILLDGASLVSEFQKGKETKNYDGFFRESARVAGGWTGAVALGTTFAKASAVASSPLIPIAPWAPPLCGLVGGAVGSVIGYTGGSQIATWGYDIQKTQPKSVSSIHNSYQSQAQTNLVSLRTRDSAMNSFAPAFHFQNSDYFRPFTARPYSYYSPYFSRFSYSSNTYPYHFSSLSQFNTYSFSTQYLFRDTKVRDAVQYAIQKEMQGTTPNIFSAYLTAQSQLGAGFLLSLSEFRSVAASTHLITSYNNFNPLSNMRDVANFCKDIGGVATEVALIEDLIDSDAHALASDYVICFPSENFPFSDRLLTQMQQELASAYFTHKTTPFFSLHFNDQGFLYPVIHPAFENTLVGEVIGFLDFWMKCFLNGGAFDSNFLKTWHHSANCDETFLRSHLIDLKKYCAEHCKEMDYFSLRELLSRHGLKDKVSQTTYKQPYRTSFRIIAYQEKIERQGNVFIPHANFRVEYTIEPMPDYKKYLEDYRKEHGCYPEDYQHVLNCYELYAQEIQEKLPKIPFCRDFFQLLGIMNFFCYFNTTLDRMGKIPVVSSAIDQSYSAFPKALPPIPVRYYRHYPVKISFNEVLQALSNEDTLFDAALLNLFTERLTTHLPEVFVSKIRCIVTKLINDKLRPHFEGKQDLELNDHEIERITRLASQFLLVNLLKAKQEIHQSLNQEIKSMSVLVAKKWRFVSLPKKLEKTKALLVKKLSFLKERWEASPELAKAEIYKETPDSLHGELDEIFKRMESQIRKETEVRVQKVQEENAAYVKSEIERYTQEKAEELNQIITELKQKEEEELNKQYAEVEQIINEQAKKEIEEAKQVILKLEEANNFCNQEINLGSQAITRLNEVISQMKQQADAGIIQQGAAIEAALNKQYDDEVIKANADIARLQGLITQLNQNRTTEIAKNPKASQAQIKAFSDAIDEKIKSINQAIAEIGKAILEGRVKVASDILKSKYDIQQEINKKSQLFCTEQEKKIKTINEEIIKLKSSIDTNNQTLSKINEAIKEVPVKKASQYIKARLVIRKEVQAQTAQFIEQEKSRLAIVTKDSIANFTQKQEKLLEEKIAHIHEFGLKVLQLAYKTQIFLIIENLCQKKLEALTGFQEDISHFSRLNKLLSSNPKITEHLVSSEYTQAFLCFNQNELGDNVKVVGGCGMSLPNIKSSAIHNAEAFLNAVEIACPIQPEQISHFMFEGQGYKLFRIRVNNKQWTENVSPQADNILHLLEEMAENENAPLAVSPESAREPLDASGASFVHYAAGLLPEPVFSKAVDPKEHPKDQFGLLPIHTAAVSGNADVVAKLAANSLQREAKTNRGATPLILAIEHGQLAVVEKLIECGANANEHLSNGLFPLYLAIQNNYPQIAVLLLDKVDKLDVNAHPDSGMTPLHLAIENGLDTVALLLIAKKAVLDSRRKADGFTPFHLAAQSGKLDLMRAMLAAGLSVHVALESQKTGLHLAAENGHLEAVYYLLEQGASADAKTTDGETPLMLAIQAGYEGIALELTKTAAVNACNQQQQSASLLAVQHAMPNVADALIARGEKVEQADRHGYDYVYYLTRQGDLHRLTALINGKIVSPRKQYKGENLIAIAAKYGHFLIVYELLDRGISFRSKQGELSLIHYAVIADEIAYLQEWLEEYAIHDANVDGKSLAVFAAGAGSLRCLAYLLKQSKPTATEARQLIQACCENNHRSALELVIPFIADINQTVDAKNNTALHCAIRHGAVSIVEMLLGLGCNAQVRNGENQTPFHIAVLQEDTHLLKRLFKQTKPQDWPDDLSPENSSSGITQVIDKYRKRLPAKLITKLPSDEKKQQSNKKELRSAKVKPYIQNIQALLSNQAFEDAADLFEEQPELIQIFNSEQGAVLFKSLFQSLYDLSDATTNAADSHARLLSLLQKNKINPAHHLGKENVLLAIIRSGDENLACYRLNLLATYFPESLSLLANDKVSPNVKVIELALKLNKLKLFARLDEVCSDGLMENKHFSALHQAVLADSYGLVKTLLKRYSANVTNTRKQTPLMLAALKGNLRLMELLLLHGASVDSCDLEGQSALYYAILGKSEQAALTLLPLLRFPNQPNRKGSTPLLLAAGQGLLAVVRYLCGQKNAMETRDNLGRNALHYASIHGQVSVIGFLVQQKFAIDAREEPRNLKKIRQSSQRTPLHLAALAGKIEAVIKLVESGANPGLKCRFGKTVTEYAILSKSTPMLQLIQQLPFYHDEANDQSLIEAAAIGNHEEVIEELLLDGASFNTLNEHGQNALHVAALSNAANVAELLVNHEEIAIDLPDLAGNSPIHLAAHRGYVRSLETLVNAGCKINKRNARQETALFIACEQGNLGAVCLLVKQGADTALANAQGISPLQAAQNAGHKEIVEILQVLKPESSASSGVLLKRFGLYQDRAPKPDTDRNYKEEMLPFAS